MQRHAGQISEREPSIPGPDPAGDTRDARVSELPLIEQVEHLFSRTFRPRGGRSWPDLQPAHQDLTMAQFRALMVLAKEQPLTIGTLGDRLKVGLPAASRMVDRLVQDGLAERADDPADRRRALVRLAARGQESVSQMHQGREHMRERMGRRLRQMETADLEHLRMGLSALIWIIESEEQAAAEATDSRSIKPD